MTDWREKYLNKITCGDCLELMRDLPDNSIDLVVTDPPYGIEYKSNYYKYGNPHREIAGDDSLLLPDEEYVRILKPSGALFFFFSYKVWPKVNLKNKIVWVKNNWSAGDLNGDFGNQYEEIGFVPMQEFKMIGKRLSNVWFADREKSTYHPTQKPVELFRKAIRSACPQDGIIIDTFVGGGSSMLAAYLEGVNSIGFEINPDYCAIAQKRLDAVRNQTDLFR